MRTGKSEPHTGRHHPRSVHPRAYGEELLLPFDPYQCSGSPPCVRGRAAAVSLHVLAPRFTPVRTGKRAFSPCARRGISVHPRAYGEEPQAPARAGRVGGSPPCVRGRGPSSSSRRSRQRFTPVRTGKRFSFFPRLEAISVHPRAYGEEIGTTWSAWASRGSPPCVRGRGSHAGRLRQPSRFTPVRTGKSAPAEAMLAPIAVHPRAYGKETGKLLSVGAQNRPVIGA